MNIIMFPSKLFHFLYIVILLNKGNHYVQKLALTKNIKEIHTFISVSEVTAIILQNTYLKNLYSAKYNLFFKL